MADAVGFKIILGATQIACIKHPCRGREPGKQWRQLIHFDTFCNINETIRFQEYRIIKLLITHTSKLKEMIMPRITPVASGRADVATPTSLAYSGALNNDGLNAGQKEGVA